MGSSGLPEKDQQGIPQKLRFLMKRFPRGLNLSCEDLGLIGWLFFYQETRGAQAIPESELKWLVSEAVNTLTFDSKFDAQSFQPSPFIQRLLRLGILRLALTDSSRQGYTLTTLGRSLAGNLIQETDYSSEQLNTLLGTALKELQTLVFETNGTLFKYLRYVFLGTIREKVEMKLLALEEDLEERKGEVKRTYSGQSQADFERAISDIEYCRIALTELVDAVQESSACVAIEELLHHRMTHDLDPDLYDALEQSLDFTYILRARVDLMLKSVVHFIHDCVAFRSLAFTVDTRERLRRIQEKILAYALDHVVRMPILTLPELPRLDVNWSRKERERPVPLDLVRLKSLDDYRPPELPPVEPGWKAAFLELARSEWQSFARKGGVDLDGWLNALAERLPQLTESLALALWFLTQDWPRWTPPVSVVHQRGRWVPLGREWMMEAVRLVPTRK